MATSFDVPAQFERDLRSAHTDFKRSKDSSAKWSHGARPVSGCFIDWTTLEAAGGSDSQRLKSRPRPKYSECNGHFTKEKHNIVKTTRGNWELPSSRVRSNFSAREEIRDATSRSIVDLLPSPGRGGDAGGFLYSYDQIDSPPPVLSLEVFIKQPTARAMEKLVEKEYEVLDDNGEAVKGRKARQVLRKAAHSPMAKASAGAEVDEDDDFELV